VTTLQIIHAILGKFGANCLLNCASEMWRVEFGSVDIDSADIDSADIGLLA